jgi:RHS repeat-associated protein
MKILIKKSVLQSIPSLLLVIFNFSIVTGNITLDEWTASTDESNSTINEKGETEHTTPENLITWIFEDGTFIPMAKLQGYKSYSIITDHLGTPVESYDEDGKKVWSRDLGIYGQTRNEFGTENFIPFLYQGQYLDAETELAYNRFRYYSPESGTYVSQDPIGLKGAMPNIYAYVADSVTWVDPYGLMPFTPKPITEGSVFRGVSEGSPHNYSPSPSDLAHADTHPGISSKPKNNSQARKFFQGKGQDIKAIDVGKLNNFDVIQDGKAHASIKPSQDYLDRKEMTMAEALDDWAKGGDDHELSKELKAASSCA